MVSPKEVGRPDPLAVRRAEGRAEVRALASGSLNPSVFAWWAFEGCRGLTGLCPFFRPEIGQQPQRVGSRSGGRLSPALVLVGPQSLARRHQAPWEGPLVSSPRVRVRPQEAGRPGLPAVRGAEGRAEVRALASGILGPRVLAHGAFECRWGLRGTCLFSRPEYPVAT